MVCAAGQTVLEMRLQYRIDFFAGKRLAQKVGHVQLLGAGHLVWLQRVSKHDNHESLLLGGRKLLVRLQKLETVHHRHIHIEQHKGRVGFVRVGLLVLLQKCESLLAILGYQQLVGHCQIFQQTLIQKVVHRVIVDQQNTR